MKMSIVIKDEVRQMLEELANRSNRTMGNQIEYLIIKEFFSGQHGSKNYVAPKEGEK